MQAFVVFLLILILHLDSGARTGVSGQLLSLASDDYTPTRLWQLDNAHHGQSPNVHSLYAYLHNVPLAPGPHRAGTKNSSLHFAGTADSYVDIPNTGGSLDATTAFSWVMMVKPTSVVGEKVILEYWDGSVGGIRLKQIGDELGAELVDTNNKVYTVQTTWENVFTVNQWKFITMAFVGVSKQKITLYHSHYQAEKPNDKVSVYVDYGAVARGTGHVRLGATQDDSSNLEPFAGNLACLRYYNAYIGKFQHDYYPLTCDPESGTYALDSLSEYTQTYVESTTVVLTTPLETTEQTTQGEETTRVETTTTMTTSTATTTLSQNEETSPHAGTQEESIPEPTSAATQPTSDPIVTTDVITRRNICAIEDSCTSLTRNDDVTFTLSSTILAEIETDSLNVCVGSCLASSGCRAIAIEKKVRDLNTPGQCLLGGDGTLTVAGRCY